MSSIPYEKMPSCSSPLPPPPKTKASISIFDRLQTVDSRVWFFGFIVGSIVYDVTKIEYLLQFGFKVNTIHIPVYLIINAFLLFAAVKNHLTAMRMVKVYSIILLLSSTIITVLCPVWMIYSFDHGAPERIRIALEHGEHYHMNFGQSVAYCIYFELLLIMDVAYYAIQLFLAEEVIQVLKKEQKESCVEMRAMGTNV